MPATLIGSAPRAACRMIAGAASTAPVHPPAFNTSRLPNITSPSIVEALLCQRSKGHAMEADQYWFGALILTAAPTGL